MSTQQTIRVQARPLVVHDGDTYLMLLDLHGRGLNENGCVTEWIRLRDYSARELSDTAADDPQGLGRVNGVSAQGIAEDLLINAAEVIVELVGDDQPTHAVSGQSLDRYLGWIWVDGQPLGPILEAHHAVAAGAFEGVTVAEKWRFPKAHKGHRR